MSTRAYSIGRTEPYDSDLRDRAARGVPLWKVGRFREDGSRTLIEGEPYSGGIVFESKEQASDYLNSPSWASAFADDDVATYSIYELELGGEWERETYLSDDGRRYLLHRARIIKRADSEQA